MACLDWRHFVALFCFFAWIVIGIVFDDVSSLQERQAVARQLNKVLGIGFRRFPRITGLFAAITGLRRFTADSLYEQLSGVLTIGIILTVLVDRIVYRPLIEYLRA